MMSLTRREKLMENPLCHLWGQRVIDGVMTALLSVEMIILHARACLLGWPNGQHSA